MKTYEHICNYRFGQLMSTENLSTFVSINLNRYECLNRIDRVWTTVLFYLDNKCKMKTYLQKRVNRCPQKLANIFFQWIWIDMNICGQFTWTTNARWKLMILAIIDYRLQMYHKNLQTFWSIDLKKMWTSVAVLCGQQTQDENLWTHLQFGIFSIPQ